MKHIKVITKLSVLIFIVIGLVQCSSQEKAAYIKQSTYWLRLIGRNKYIVLDVILSGTKRKEKVFFDTGVLHSLKFKSINDNNILADSIEILMRTGFIKVTENEFVLLKPYIIDKNAYKDFSLKNRNAKDVYLKYFHIDGSVRIDKFSEKEIKLALVYLAEHYKVISMDGFTGEYYVAPANFKMTKQDSILFKKEAIEK